MQDDILTKLAKIADLKVISRTSVMEYRGKRNVRQIGDALRVSHVLEGSVRRSGDRLHLNAQLIDTRTDTHVWAEQYDRDLNDLFAIQSEIAQKVAERLNAKITATEKLAIEGKPTADLIAFDLYTRAKNLFLTAPFSGDAEAALLAGNRSAEPGCGARSIVFPSVLPARLGSRQSLLLWRPYSCAVGVSGSSHSGRISPSSGCR